MTNNIYLITYLITFIPIIAIFAFMPYVARRSIFFGVSAPRVFYDTDKAKNMRKSYTIKVIATGIAIILASLLSNYYFDEKHRITIMLISVFVLIGIIILIYIGMWSKAKQLKNEFEWYKKTTSTAVTDTSFYSSKIAVSPYWFIVYLLIIVSTVILGLVCYSRMPQNVPIQTDLDGIVKYAQKSYQLIFYMPLVQLFLSATFAFVYYSVKRARPELSSQDVKKTVEQNIKFRYAWSCFLVFGGMLLLGVFLLTQLEMLSLIENDISMIATYSIVGVMLISAIILAVKLGQSGSKIKATNKKDDESIDRADDANWKLGMFYVNKDDPSLFVEKRFGVGFTINFGRPTGWVVLTVVVIIVIGAIIIDR